MARRSLKVLNNENENSSIRPVAVVRPGESAEQALYEVRKKIYPRAVHGWFAAWRWALVWLTQLVFYGGAWLQWNGRQALLFDIAHRKFYIFGLVFWPQDIIYLTVLLVISALSLFLFTTVAGRLWCGYACPQTVYTEIFMWVEKLIEGDRAKRIRLDRGAPSPRKLGLKAAKHAVWLAIALWTGFTFVGYFTPIRELWPDVWSASAGPWSTFWILFYGFATYGNAGWMREQVCKYMCPYARFQSAMFDPDTLIITYDERRGEPRGGRARGADLQALKLGDCVDCGICVQVCPTGIDISNGLQYECIGCAACIDGCNQVMDKMGYARGLIRYSTEHAIERGLDQAQMMKRAFRPRVLVYSAILWLIIIAAAGEPVAARAAQGRRDPRSRRDRARGRGRENRERLPAADHEHHRGAAPLRHLGRRLAHARAGESRRGRGRRRGVARGDGQAARRSRHGGAREAPHRVRGALARRARNQGRREVDVHRPLGAVMSSLAQSVERPWYREPWPWILMAAPAAAVVAGFATLWIAVSTSDGLVAEDYYRQGLAINRVLERESAAARLGIVARAEPGAGRLVVRLEGRIAPPAALTAWLAHATRAGHDMRLRLAREAGGDYAAALPRSLPAGRWHVSIEDPGRDWRVIGMWSGSAQPFTLTGNR